MNYIIALLIIGVAYHYQAWYGFTAGVFYLGCLVGSFFANFEDHLAP